MPRLLTEPRVAAELIADGFHVAEEVLRMAFAAGGPDGVVLVTDAMVAAGMPDGAYRLGSLAVQVVDGQARLETADGSLGSIAGSTLTTGRAFALVVGLTGDLPAAARLASTNAARHFGLDAGRVEAGGPADLCLVDDTGVLQRVLRRGRWVEARVTGAPRVDVRTALADRDLPTWVEVLGFSPDDAAEVRAAAAALLDQPDRLARGADGGGPAGRGRRGPAADQGTRIWRGCRSTTTGSCRCWPCWRRRRSSPPSTPPAASPPTSRRPPWPTWGSRPACTGWSTAGSGSARHAWEAGYVWSGALFRLGRLQFDLERQATVDGTGEEWVLSTHIPRGERLVPDGGRRLPRRRAPVLRRALRRAPGRRRALPQLDARRADPRPAARLEPGLVPAALADVRHARPGDEDALFFGFARGAHDRPAGGAGRDLAAAGHRLGVALRQHWLVVDGRLRR